MDKNVFTLDEKIKLVKGMGSWHTNNLDGKIESIHLADGPHGLRAQEESAKSNNDSIIANCFPTACASACSFDRKLIHQMAGAIADEAKAANVSVLLGPGVNMKRSPLCGRNFEYFSEDPYLAGELATEYVKGAQQKGVATSLKHFAANSQETHRMTANSVVDERALREIYLRAFEKVVKSAKPATVMASYNLLNGKPACENKWLLTDVLRKEWGYEGLVMSDWGACVDAGACIEAGMDLEMPDSHGNHNDQIISALKEGRLSKESFDRAVGNVCKLVENYPAGDNTGLKQIPDSMLKENSKLASKIAEESAVLLKNEGVLPLVKQRRVIVLGELAERMRVQGGGSSHIHTKRLTNALDAFKAEGIEVIYFRGYDSEAKDKGYISSADKKIAQDAINGISKEIEKKSDIPVIVFGGLTNKAEGEGYDRVSMELPTNQRELFAQLKKITTNVIYVSFGGSPYDMSDIAYAKAILNMYLGGEGVAVAAVNLLLGKKNPSGRLPETWPLSIEGTPCYNNFGRQNKTVDDVLYAESIFVGYRYYDSFNVPVCFPFGHGLSYTNFVYSNLMVKKNGTEVKILVDITNAGEVSGKETILVFVKNAPCKVIRAKRELRGFEKVNLAPKEKKTVTIVLDDRAFDIYDTDSNGYITVSGKYEIEISKAVGEVILSQSFEVGEGSLSQSFEVGEGSLSQSLEVGEGSGTLSIGEEENDLRGLHKDDKRRIPSYEALETERKDRFSRADFEKLYGKEIPNFTNIKPGGFSTKNSLSQMAPYSAKARFLLKFGKIAIRFMTGAPLDDPESRMMFEGISEGNIESVCNQSGGIISHRMIEKIIEQANKEGRR